MKIKLSSLSVQNFFAFMGEHNNVGAFLHLQL